MKQSDAKLSAAELERGQCFPASVFAAPEAVLNSGLSAEQMVETLNRWEFDVRELMVATEENMPGDDTGDLLQRIRAVLRSIPGVKLATPEGPSTKHR